MNKRKLIFHIVLVLIPVLLTILVTSCFNKKDSDSNINNKYSSTDEYLNTSSILLSNNPVTLKCGWIEVGYINDYKQLKETKIVLLTNTKVFKEDLNNEIHFQEITNPIINNINTKTFKIYVSGKWLWFFDKEILEINKNNVSKMIYINEKTKQINLTKEFTLELNKNIELLKLMKKEYGVISFDDKWNIKVVGWKDWYKVDMNIKEIEKEIRKFYTNWDCDNKEYVLNLKSVSDSTELKEWWEHWITEVIWGYNMSFTKSQKESVKNIETISWLVNWKIIRPGEEFDLWNIIYSFWMENYEISKVIKGSKIEKEFWGWLCGYATVLYRTALYTGLDITKRYPHSIYTNNIYGNKELWLDSAIYLWGKNLKFKNNTWKYIYIKSEFNSEKKNVSINIYWTKKYNSITMEWPIKNKDNKKEVTWYRVRDWEKEEIKSLYNEIH